MTYFSAWEDKIENKKLINPIFFKKHHDQEISFGADAFELALTVFTITDIYRARDAPSGSSNKRNARVLTITIDRITRCASNV